MKKLSSLSVFFPAYNDGKIIPYLITKIYSILPQVTKKFEVIIVNDGSTDDSSEVLLHLKNYYPDLRVVTHANNRGYGGALQSGFKNAKYDWIFYTDGDGQYDPQELFNLVKKVTTETDVVNGYKIKRSDAYIRKVIGSLYSRLLRFLYKIPIRDIDCDFRLIKRSYIKNIHFTSSSGMICLELIQKLDQQKAHFKEVPVHHYSRAFGHSQFFRLPHLIKTLRENVEYFKKTL